MVYVMGDVVRRDAERAAQLSQHRAVVIDDVRAVAGRAGVAPRAAVEVRRDHEAGGAGGAGEAGEVGGTKYRMRWQLSHCTI